MSHKKLAEIVVWYIELLELEDEKRFDSRVALKRLESISANLTEATPEERAAVMQAAKDRLTWFLQEPDQYGYTPRKTLRPEHQRLLEGISSGEVFGWSLDG